MFAIIASILRRTAVKSPPPAEKELGLSDIFVSFGTALSASESPRVCNRAFRERAGPIRVFLPQFMLL
ncbi:hypothetical protein WJX82_004662 [Trebouxia sp. C0006]